MPRERGDSRRPPTGLRAGLPSPCGSSEQSHTAAQAISEPSCAPVTVLLKTFQWTLSALRMEQGLVRVALGTEDAWAQVSVVLKGNPNKNRNEWYV